MNCPQWAARGARGVVKWRARAAGWYGLMPAAPLLGRVSAPRTAHRERIGAIEHGGNRRGCEAPLCVPFLLLVYGATGSASGDRRAVMSDLLKLLLHDTINSNPLDFAVPTHTVEHLFFLPRERRIMTSIIPRKLGRGKSPPRIILVE